MANQDWIDGRLIWVGQDADGLITREVLQPSPHEFVVVRSNRSVRDDIEWATCVLGTHRVGPPTSDPVVQAIATSHPGMRPLSNGSVFAGW